MRVPLRRTSKAREGRIPYRIRPTSNAVGVDAAVPEWIVYFDQAPLAEDGQQEHPRTCNCGTNVSASKGT
jgi:hypothetical protein